MPIVKRRFPDVLFQQIEKHRPTGDIVTSPPSGNVSSPSYSYREMLRRWDLPVHLLGGTLAMRDAGEKWLPKEPAEREDAYQNRLQRTELYGAFKRTVQALSGYPFLRPAVMQNLPEELSYLDNETVDNGERDINGLGQDQLKDLLTFGKSHILIDYPAIQAELRLGEEKELNIRPYFVDVSPLNIIGWQSEKIGAVEHLMNVRIAEQVWVNTPGSFEAEEIQQIRVVYPDRFEIWRENQEAKKNPQEDSYYLYEQLPNDLGYIPLVTIYANRTGFMTAEPPLEDLAWLNLKHYRSQSDQDHILHTARVPILFGPGWQEGELESAEIGPNRVISVSDPQADLKYVEHTGQAIAAGETSIKNLEERMAVMGADFLTTKSVARQTAQARVIDQTETLSVLESIVRNLEQGLEQAVRIAGDWLDVEAENVTVEIGENLSLNPESNAPEFLRTLFDIGLISRQQFYKELKRRGILADYFDEDEAPTEPPVTQPTQETNPEETSETQ